MTESTVSLKTIWQHLITNRAVKLILPRDKLNTLVVGLHKKRQSERALLASIGVEEELSFSRGESLRVIRDRKFGNGGIDENGCVSVTILIGPVPRQTYTMIDESEGGQDAAA